MIKLNLIKKDKILKKRKNKIRIEVPSNQSRWVNFHSDGPQLDQPKKYVIMACEHNANKGGDSCFSKYSKNM